MGANDVVKYTMVHRPVETPVGVLENSVLQIETCGRVWQLVEQYPDGRMLCMDMADGGFEVLDFTI